MVTELRKTGIGVVGDIPWGTHFCYFYETTQDLLDTLVSYFIAGLENNEFCLWIVSNSELLTFEEAKHALRQALPDIERYFEAGSIEIVSHDEWFQDGGTFNRHRVANQFKEKLDDALARGYVGIRLNGSPAWLKSKDPTELRQFEEEVDRLFAQERIIASCTYPLAMTWGVDIFDVVRKHQFAIARRQGEWEVVETPELIQAKAEIERLNEELEQRVAERTSQLAKINEELKREVTERKQAEEALRRSEDHLRLVIDTIPVMAWSLRPDGIVDFLNQRWMDYAGLSLEQYIEDPTGPVHPEDIPRVMEKWLAHIGAGEPHEDEMRLRRADGEYRWFLVRDSPLRDESGRIVKWYGVSTDIDDRKRAEEQLKATSEQLRALSARLSSAREEEGTRIARELHDELGSALTSLKWDLEGVDKLCSEADSALRAKIRGMLEQIDTIMNAVARISTELRPSVLDDLGLVAAVKWQALQFEGRTGIVCRIAHSMERVDLSREQTTAIFRILQEALTNVIRHAQATRVKITIEKEEDEFVLQISDNGRGITEDERAGPRSLGLIGMRERAHLVGGEIEITGIAGRGTVLTLRVPTND
jgi:PAS domain S-box-containing protein